MKTSMIATLLLLASVPAAEIALGAPDRIGNGGGIWSCFAPGGDLEAARLVDFYEAESLYDRPQLPQLRQDPLQIADDVASTVRERFPDYAFAWSRELQNVKARFHPLVGELKEINDSHWIAQPPRASCHGTPWAYVQFANYDDDQELIQVRKDLWESPRISSLDKAGLLWHEAVYRWTRDQLGDDTSIRARQIVGILFSTLDASAARLALDAVLKHDPNHQPTDPTFVCLARNGVNNRWFLDYGPNELSARNQTVKTCRLADPNLSFHCDEHSVRCESFTSQKQAYTCAVRNGVSNDTFTETGRSPLEAEAKARRACTEANTKLAIHCAEPACN